MLIEHILWTSWMLNGKECSQDYIFKNSIKRRDIDGFDLSHDFRVYE